MFRHIITLLFLMASAIGLQQTRALTVTADQASMKTTGSLAGGSWRVARNGDWGEYIDFASGGTYRLRVLASGSRAYGQWPQMSLRIDDRAVKTVTVSREKPSLYDLRFHTAPGVHKITLALLNDVKTERERRYLNIDSMSVEPTDSLPQPTLGDGKRWRAWWVPHEKALEETVLADARAAIERSRKGDAIIRIMDQKGHPIPGASVSVEQTSQDFLFGCNLFGFDRFPTPEQNRLYKDRFSDLFNYATTPFYWGTYEREQGKPNYAFTDKVIDWASLHGIRLKGHPLLWGSPASIPPWSKDQRPKEERNRRVSEIVGRYAGKIAFWEVVNEPVHWPAFDIGAPYRVARKADPKATLIVNEYRLMHDGYPPFYEFLQKEKLRGTPFDAIGIQAHDPIGERFRLEQVRETLDRYATLGKRIHITEFTPPSSDGEVKGSPLTGSWDETKQAEYATRFYTVCFGHPAVDAITWWDLCDKAWVKGGGLLREDLSPKPAYTALRRLIRHEWMTKLSGTTDNRGNFRFRGFYGSYVIRITVQGKTIKRTFHLRQHDRNEITIQYPAVVL